MKRDIKWLNQWIEEYESEVVEERKGELKGIVRAHSHGKQSAIKRFKQKVDQLDKPEVLSQGWLLDESMSVIDTFNRHVIAVPVDRLENLLVPEQEELEMKIQDLIENYKQKNGSYSNLENGWIGSFISNLEHLLKEEL